MSPEEDLSNPAWISAVKPTQPPAAAPTVTPPSVPVLATGLPAPSLPQPVPAPASPVALPLPPDIPPVPALEGLCDTDSGIVPKDDNERLIACILHGAVLLGYMLTGLNLLLTAGIWWVRKDHSRYLDRVGKEALNFQLSLCLLLLVFYMVPCLGGYLTTLVTLCGIVYALYAAAEVWRTGWYRYQYSARFLS